MGIDKLFPVKKYHHGALREACLREGLSELKERGVPLFSLREVARRAGVTPTAIYNHFRAKEDLLADLALEGLEKFRKSLKDSLLSGKKPKDGLTAMGAAYLDFFRRHPYYMDLIFAHGFAQHPQVKESRKDTFRMVTTLLEALGIPSEETESLALWIWAAIHGLATLIKADALGNTEDECPDDAPSIFSMNLTQLQAVVLPLFSKLILSQIPKA